MVSTHLFSLSFTKFYMGFTLHFFLKLRMIPRNIPIMHIKCVYERK